jgi:hypothetical protein
VGAVCGATVGALIGRAISPPAENVLVVRQRLPRGIGVALAAAVVALLALPLTSTVHPYSADLAMDPPLGIPGGHVHVTLKMHPANAAQGAQWFNVTAWQGARTGNGGLVIKALHETSPGVYQTDGTVPVFGEWKALVRLHKGRSLMALPIYLPADPAIPAKQVPPWPNVTRPFQREKGVLQREAVGGSQGLVRPAYAILGVLFLVWVGWPGVCDASSVQCPRTRGAVNRRPRRRRSPSASLSPPALDIAVSRSTVEELHRSLHEPLIHPGASRLGRRPRACERRETRCRKTAGILAGKRVRPSWFGTASTAPGSPASSLPA